MADPDSDRAGLTWIGPGWLGSGLADSDQAGKADSDILVFVPSDIMPLGVLSGLA